jgi:lipoprotein-releasing system ATP-binding protein
MSNEILYEVKDLCKSFSNGSKLVEVLKGVNLQVKRADTLAIMGHSGVGKSTLLNILGLLDTPTSGRIKMDGINIHELNEVEQARIRNRSIGFVFQFFQLLPEFTALENVIMPGLIAGESMQKLTTTAMEVLDEVGLADFSDRRPGELSGGEQQRVALARALIMSPDVLLADEPTGNLDPHTGNEIEQLMTRLNQSRKTTLIVVTHKESLAQIMNRRVGLVEGTLEELT